MNISASMPLLVVAVVAVVAGGIDVVRFKIPNWITYTVSWPPTLKDCLAYQWNDVAIPYWHKLVTKAKACGDMIMKRLQRAGIEAEHKNIECLGLGACVPGVLPTSSQPTEVVLRVSVRD